MAKETETALVVLEPTTALAVFTEPAKVDPIMDPLSGGFPMRTFSVPKVAGRWQHE